MIRSDRPRTLSRLLAVSLTLAIVSCSGGGGSPARPGGKGDGSGPTGETIAFEDLDPGTNVATVFGSGGTGPILVSATNPDLGDVNAAVVFDSGSPTGGDFDLGSPHEDFGGPGVGDGGSSGSPYENAVALDHVLIVAENLDDGDGDGLIDDPDDTDTEGSEITLDFSETGTATMLFVTIMDVEEREPAASVEFFDPLGASLGTLSLPIVGDNGVAIVDLGAVSGVAVMQILLNGSGAVDDVVFQPDCDGEIGDFVWHDVDRDGIQDAGEPGLEGVAVELEDADGDVVAQIVTGPEGVYAFTGLCAGEYTVRVVLDSLPPGFGPAECNAGDDDTADNDCSPATVVLETGDAFDPTIDFGFESPCKGAIGDLVWMDLDRDGLQDAGEPGIDGVAIRLTDTSGDMLAKTTTNRDGRYRFSGLCAGEYIVVVGDDSLPPGLVPTDCDVGGDDASDNDCSPVLVQLTGDAHVNPTIDFGYKTACDGSIGDLVWHDADDDGLQGAFEPGIDGVIVRLLDTSGDELAMDITGPDGRYEFTSLCAGTYVVEVALDTLPPGFEASECNVGDDDTIDNDCSPALVELDFDEARITTVDFGFGAPCAGAIGDFVWHDSNRDGLQNGDEPGLQGIELILKDELGVVIGETITDASGKYAFGGLCAGLYKVEVDTTTLPPGFGPSLCNVGDDDTIDNDCSPFKVLLPFDTAKDDTVDFGFVSECTGAIGDFVWNDLDRDGIQDAGEPGLEGVELVLKDELGVVLAVTTTGAAGEYLFTGLCAGCYRVEVDPNTLPDDFSATPCNVGDDDTIDNDCSPAKVVLAANETEDDSIDFGYGAQLEGCTPGYWKQPHHFDSWPEGIEPEMLFSDVFEDAFPGMTLVEVAAQGGGQLKALGRHTVAALLNGYSPGVNYGLTGAAVVAHFNAVFPGGDYETLKDFFEGLNEKGCPLN